MTLAFIAWVEMNAKMSSEILRSPTAQKKDFHPNNASLCGLFLNERRYDSETKTYGKGKTFVFSPVFGDSVK